MRPEDLGDPRALDLQIGLRALAMRVTSPKRSRSVGDSPSANSMRTSLVWPKRSERPESSPSIDELAVGDDEDAVAEGLDVAHVVAGQEHGHAAARVVLAQAFLDRHLGHDVEADRRLVEQEDLGLVEQGGDQLHLHPLAEGQLADGLAGELLDAEQLGQLAEGLAELVVGDGVDLPVELEAVGGGQVPPELVLLAHDEGELAAEGVLAVPGDEVRGRGRRRCVG